MNLDGIDVFVKVIQAGSFSAAAKQMGMPITTVSGKIASLEKRLGVTLIQRTTRKLNITQAGEVFFKSCVRALEEVQSAELQLATSKSEPEGTLKITAVLDVGHAFLIPLVREYLKRYPKMKVEMRLTNRILDLVGEGIDLAIRVGELKDSSLIAKKLTRSSAGLWASPQYLKKTGKISHPRDLKDRQIFSFAGYPNPLKLQKGKEKIEVVAESRVSCDDMISLKILALSGDGICVVPDFVCENEARENKLVHILPEWSWQTFDLSFVYPAQKFVPPKVQAFMSLAAEKNFK